MSQSFNTIITGDSQLDRIQANIASAFNNVAGPFIGGMLITGIKLIGGTPLPINHGLGRTPILWTLADINAATNVYRTAWSSSTITLIATVNCTIAIWVN